MSKISPAVIKETRNVAIATLAGTLLMFLVFFVANKIDPEFAPFDHTVILGGICGTVIAVLNFFLMGLTVQKVTAIEDDKEARRTMQKSYYRRFGLQILWVIAAIAAPCFNLVAGIVPLIFPGLSIKVRGILFKKTL